MNLNRRLFLAAGGALAMGQPYRLFSNDSEKLPVIDTHVHCFGGTSQKQFPYHPKAPYRPRNATTPQRLLTCMEQANVKKAVIVHPEPYQDDHRYLEHCLNIGNGKLTGTVLLFADRPGSVEQMPQLVRQMPIIAVRVHAYAPGRLPPFGTPELRNLWKTASDLGIAVQIHFEPRYAAGFEPYIAEFKTTRVIIDHMGRPFQGTPTEHERVLRWSHFPNTIIKLSSIPDNLKYPHRQIGPIINRLVMEYGINRVIYGGGFGEKATGQSYRQVIDSAVGHLKHLSVPDRKKVLYRNALKLIQDIESGAEV